MGNCAALPLSPKISKKNKSLPIEQAPFRLPAPLPTWPAGGGFSTGVIDLGGLVVSQISSFTKVWGIYQGGPNNSGATFFEPSEVPEGFCLLGCYSQPNNRPLFGAVLVAKDESPDDSLLAKPVDYTLVWSSESQNVKKDGNGYFWVPIPPDGYKSMGVVITTSPEKPSLEKIRCVRSDFTDESGTDEWIWSPQNQINNTGFNVFSLTPSTRGVQAMGIPVGTFAAGNGNGNFSIPCLKNKNSDFSSMPNLEQIEALFRVYSPWIYLHPDEKYQPSSVSWLFTNGALLYKKGEESSPVPIDPTGSNLPQGGSNDGAYWIDLPVDNNARERVKKGDLRDSRVYLHVKPMLGASFTDIAVWVFYPFNGPGRAKVGIINLDLGKIGQHVGDWEHLTLRISNFNGELKRMYFSEHSSGLWVNAPELEFQGGNKPVSYSSLNGHAMYAKPGLVLQGNDVIGIRNDTAKSKMFVDTGGQFSVVAAEHLGSAVVEPPWLNYYRVWGPKIDYDIDDQIKKIEKVLPGKLKTAFDKFVKSLPKEVLGEEGPTGPKSKSSWSGDEK